VTSQPLEGWTDLHIHPILADWRPAATELPTLLERLGIATVGHALAHAVADHWDAEDEAPEPLAELEEPSLEAVADLATRPDCVYLSLLCDPVACGYQDLLAALRTPRDPWRPCVLSVGWGPTSIPDPRLDRTAARFAWSLAIGGPGLPAKPEIAARGVPGLPPVQAQIKQLSEILGRPCTAHVAYGDGV
jgi:hypothetical protein